MVYYKHNPGNKFIVIRIGPRFAYIVDSLRHYPKSNAFYVPIELIAIVPFPAPDPITSPPPPAARRTVKGSAPKTLLEFLQAATAHGASPAHTDELREIYHTPAPNNGVRNMRMRNFFKHHLGVVFK